MKTKLFAGSVILLMMGALTALAGGRFFVGSGRGFIATGGFCNRGPICAPYRTFCYPSGICYSAYYPNYSNYCSVGPAVVYYSSEDAGASVSSIFTTTTPVSPVVPAPVLLTQPVKVQPLSFGWSR